VADGTLAVKQTLLADGTKETPNMLRFGMTMQMPYDLDRSQFYGRGPIENYNDRHDSQRLGIYSQTSDDQLFPYIRPQENGNKTDIRWWRQTNSTGRGILVETLNGEPLSMSALHYAQMDLDDGDEKEQRHTPDVPRSKYVNLCIDQVQAGVGGIDSWSGNAEALEKYRVKCENRSYSFVIKPVK